MEVSTMSTLIVSAGIWTILACCMAVYLRYSSSSAALIKYHAAAATLIALPAGIVVALLSDLSGLLPAAASVPLLNPQWLTATELPAVVVGGGSASAESPGAAGFSVAWIQVLTAVLLGMIACGLIRLSFIYLNLKKGLNAAVAITDGTLLAMLQDICKTKGVKRPVRLLSTTETSVPFTSGLLNPVIVLPRQWVEGKSSAQIALVLTHETVHISRVDYTIHLCELFIRHIFWMHPLVHHLYHQSAYWREVACDEEVLRHPEANITEYAQLLYDFALHSNEKPVFKAAMAQERKLIGRIKEMNLSQQINPKHKTQVTMKKSIFAAFGIMILFAGAMACSDLTQNPDVETQKLELTDEVEVLNQTYTVQQFRDMIADSRDNSQSSLDAARSSENPPEQSVLDAIEEHVNLMSNLVMLIDNGEASRAINGYVDFVNNNPPPPPTPPQPGDTQDGNEDVFIMVEQMPEMIGGQRALFENLQYPQEAREAGIEGRAIVQFIVGETGNVRNITVVRSSGSEVLDQAAIEAISQMEFTPGMQRGQNVAVQMVQPVVFRLS